MMASINRCEFMFVLCLALTILVVKVTRKKLKELNVNMHVIHMVYIFVLFSEKASQICLSNR